MATGNVYLNCYNITSSYNNVAGVVNKNLEIMQWSSPIDPRRRYQDVSTDRSGGVGNWLLEINEFRGWVIPSYFATGIWEWGRPIWGRHLSFKRKQGRLLMAYNISPSMTDNLCDKLYEEVIAIAIFDYHLRDQQEQTTIKIAGFIINQAGS